MVVETPERKEREKVRRNWRGSENYWRYTQISTVVVFETDYIDEYTFKKIQILEDEVFAHRIHSNS